MAEEPTIDVAALVRDIESEVERRRADGDYPAELLQRIHADFGPDVEVRSVDTLAVIDTARPVESTRVGGTAVAWMKRCARRLIAWYVQPIMADQTRFNLAAVREMRALERRLRRLETPWADAPPGSDRGMASTRSRLDAARAATLAPLLRGAPSGGQVQVVGDAAILVAHLRGQGVDAVLWPPEAKAGDHPDLFRHLDEVPNGSLAAVVLAGVLPRLTAAELTQVVPLATATLRGGGVFVADAPDPRGPGAPPDPSAVDMYMQRWVSPETATVLCEAAPLTGVRVVAVSGGTDGSSWYAVTGVREQPGERHPG